MNIARNKASAARLVAAVTIAALHDVASAAVRLVPSEFPTIQSAINASASGDVVEVANGVYTGPGNRNITINKNITVRSASGEAATCVIDCQRQTRGVTFVQTTRVATMQGFTITNGLAVFGAGVYFVHSGTLKQCVIADNHGNSNDAFDGNGGGISCSNVSSPAIIDCVIQGNSAKSGGGVFARSPFTTPALIRGCTVSGNSSSLSGGGVECSLGAMDLIECLVTDNSVGPPIPGFEIGTGGGVLVFLGNLNILNCTISHNTLDPGLGTFPASGAGVGVSALSTNPSNLVMVNCLVWGNGDEATDQGGGLYNNGGSITISTCTFAVNTATLTGSAYHEVNNPTSLAGALINSIFWGNSSSAQLHQIQLDDANNSNFVSHSFVEGGLGAVGGFSPLWGPGNLGDMPQDRPQFVNPQDGDFRLLSPSVASANAGEHSLLPPDTFDLDDDGDIGELVSLDLDGLPRLVGCVDLGPFEHQEPGCLQDFVGSLGVPDGLVNTDDLLFIIGMWATLGGRADIVPAPCGDDIVGIDDFLAVLNGWGDCN